MLPADMKVRPLPEMKPQREHANIQLTEDPGSPIILVRKQGAVLFSIGRSEAVTKVTREGV